MQFRVNIFLFVPLLGDVRCSVIGNVAKDLRKKLPELGARRARIVAEGTLQLCES